MTGIETRHARSCRSRKGGRCNCEPTYRAGVWDGKHKIRQRFDSFAEAKNWRADAQRALRRGKAIQGPSKATLRAAAAQWIEAARSGALRTRSGDLYKPSAIRSYEASLRLRVLPKLGDEPVAEIRRADLQEIVGELIADGMAENTIEATMIPVRSIFRRELERDRLKVNPTAGLTIPKSRSRRERIADPEEARALLAAVPFEDRATWATAMYAGLRRGELKALRARKIDLEANVVHVVAGWDDKEGEIETKGRQRRRVPIPQALREILLAHLMRSGRRDEDLVFGETAASPFKPKDLTSAADEAWKAAKLSRITLHECRHAYASLMIAAGVNAKALCDYMGHSSIVVTYDRYGHLMPGNEDQAAGLLDAYLERARGVAGA